MITRSAEIRPEIYKDVFQDVTSDKWYAKFIQAAYNKNIAKGDIVRPNDFITREEMCDMIVKAYARDIPETKELTFADSGEISDRDAVSRAYNLGVIAGYEDNSFKPKSGLTRAEAVSVILNFYDVNRV